MTSMGQRLYKKEKLCSVIAIGQLFGARPARPAGSAPSSGPGVPGAADVNVPAAEKDAHAVRSTSAYPLRMLWRVSPGRRSDAPVQFLVSIPKKKFKHAVDRVLLRRRVREAYRVNRQDFPTDPSLLLDVAFIYTGRTAEPYRQIAAAMRRLLSRLPAAPRSPEM